MPNVARRGKMLNRRDNQKLTFQEHSDIPGTQSTLGTRHTTETYKAKNTLQKRMRIMYSKIKQRVKPMFSRRISSYCFIRHPPFYSFSSPVKVLSVIKERRNLRKREKTRCHGNGYIVAIYKFVSTATSC
jgi:hypothetical protein